MSNIIKNEACPRCREAGHDSSGNHLIRFADGGGYCSRKHFHKDGKVYYEQAGTAPLLSDLPITGEIKYTPGEFRDLEAAGKLKDPLHRQLALGGMRMADRYEVLTPDEQAAVHEEWQREVEWFGQLKRTHLVTRAIHGLVAAFYDIRVGHNEGQREVNRHYYPRHEGGEQVGAKCRTLPKDFRFGHLGKLFGKQDLFGMHTWQKVAESGQKKYKVLVVGGELDCAAAQQMLVKELNNLSELGNRANLDGLKKFYICSVNKGENCIQELIDNKEQLDQFSEIIWGFDDDEVGRAMVRQASKLFRGKSKRLVYPKGCKDANACLLAGRDSEFTTAVFKAEEAVTHGKLKRVKDTKAAARVIPEMGKRYHLKGLNAITYGIRLNYLHVWGAGTGIGKTDTTIAYASNLMEQGEDVVVIYLENQVAEVARTFAGMLVNKDFNSPPQQQWELDEGFEYNPARDYTQKDLDDALDALDNQDQLLIADLGGSKDVDSVMQVMEEALALGYRYFIIDNLTAFEHKGDNGEKATSSRAIDETMKRLGTFKDENPVNIFLLSHLIKVGDGRIPHVHGGEVYESDFRGSGAITFWANAVWGIERNTMAPTLAEKCITLYRNIKNRGIGHKVGSTVLAQKDLRTGKYHELEGEHELPSVGVDKQKKGGGSGFDMGDRANNRGTPIAESKPADVPVSSDGSGLALMAGLGLLAVANQEY